MLKDTEDRPKEYVHIQKDSPHMQVEIGLMPKGMVILPLEKEVMPKEAFVKLVQHNMNLLKQSLLAITLTQKDLVPLPLLVTSMFLVNIISQTTKTLILKLLVMELGPQLIQTQLVLMLEH